MGMYDSFYFAEGVLPDNRESPEKEFQTKGLEQALDNYYVSKDLQVTIEPFIIENDGIKTTYVPKVPDIENLQVYSYEFEYDNPINYINRKLLNTREQIYLITIKDGKLIKATKIKESGYENAK